MNITSIKNYQDSNAFKANVIMDSPKFEKYFYDYANTPKAKELVNKFKAFKPNEDVKFVHDFCSSKVRFFAKNLSNKKSLCIELDHMWGECEGYLRLMSMLMDKSEAYFWEKSANNKNNKILSSIKSLLGKK